MAKRRLSCFSMRESISWSSCVVKPSAPERRDCVNSLMPPRHHSQSQSACLLCLLPHLHVSETVGNSNKFIIKGYGAPKIQLNIDLTRGPSFKPQHHTASQRNTVSSPTGRDVRGQTVWGTTFSTRLCPWHHKGPDHPSLVQHRWRPSVLFVIALAISHSHDSPLLPQALLCFCSESRSSTCPGDTWYHPLPA